MRFFADDFIATRDRLRAEADAPYYVRANRQAWVAAQLAKDDADVDPDRCQHCGGPNH